MARRPNRALVGRAQLVGAYTRRRDLEQTGGDTAPADERIAELEAELPDEVIVEARRMAEPREHNPH